MHSTINDLVEADRTILRRQIQMNESLENTDNLNLTYIIRQYVETGYIDLNYFQAHPVGLRLKKSYSVATLTVA